MLPDFQSIHVLWRGSNPPFPSEQSARWQLRELRPQLAEAGALAIFRGRYFVHPARFVEVIQRVAIEAARARAKSESAEGRRDGSVD